MSENLLPQFRQLFAASLRGNIGSCSVLNLWGKILSGNAAIVVSKVDGGQVRGSRLIGTARFVGQREHILEKAFLRLSVAVQRISQHRSLSLLFVSRCENVNFFLGRRRRRDGAEIQNLPQPPS